MRPSLRRQRLRRRLSRPRRIGTRPREVTPGKAFTIGSHKVLDGWKIKADTSLGDAQFNVTGKAKNVSEATSTSSDSVVAAGRTDGRITDANTVEFAVLESAPSRTTLDAAQMALVGAMCTSDAVAAGHRPRRRWEDHRHAQPDTSMDRQRRHGGRFGSVRRRTARLHDATGAPAETLATLTWSIHHDDLPDWAQRIDSANLRDHDLPFSSASSLVAV
jgi:hypothetical protein